MIGNSEYEKYLNATVACLKRYCSILPQGLKKIKIRSTLDPTRDSDAGRLVYEVPTAIYGRHRIYAATDRQTAKRHAQELRGHSLAQARNGSTEMMIKR